MEEQAISEQQNRGEVKETGELLPLDAAERVAVFRSKGKIYRHIFKKLEAADWERFFAHVIAEFQQEKGGGYSHLVDTDVAALELYAKAILRVKGYATRDGRDPRELPSWPECVPQDHRLRAVDLLTTVSRGDEADQSMLEIDVIPISLNAFWNEGEPGTMKQYSGLVHRFRIPSAEQRRRFLKAKNRSFVAGGSRRGLTIVPTSHPVLVKLYDELIEKVEGYSWGGTGLGTALQAAQQMDTFHKSAAVGHLFPVSVGNEEEE